MIIDTAAFIVIVLTAFLFGYALGVDHGAAEATGSNSEGGDE